MAIEIGLDILVDVGADLADVLAGAVVGDGREDHDVVEGEEGVGLDREDLGDQRVLLGVRLVTIVQTLELLERAQVLSGQLRVIIQWKVKASVLLQCCVTDNCIENLFHV